MALVLFVGALVTVVRRGQEGRELSMELQRLEAEARVVADQIVAEEARIDTLTTLTRIEEAAGELGLRRAAPLELVQVRDPFEGTTTGGDR